MMIDVTNEQLLTFTEAAAMLPGRPSVATLRLWRTRGVGGRKLESIVLGGKVLTSVQALQRFAEQQGATGASPAEGVSERIELAERFTRVLMQVVISAAVLAGGFAIIRLSGNETAQKGAFTMMGTVIGYWLR